MPASVRGLSGRVQRRESESEMTGWASVAFRLDLPLLSPAPTKPGKKLNPTRYRLRQHVIIDRHKHSKTS
jgi:hypothetical protein